MPLASTLGDVRRLAHGPLRRLFVGQFLNALGNGLTLALLVVYLSTVRGIPTGQATGLLAWQAVLTLACSPVAGSLVDRFGPRPVLLGSVLVEAAGVYGYSHVHALPAAFLAMTVVAIGSSGIWGPATALTARLVAPVDRPTAFGFAFMLLNLGIGLGGLISSAIVDLADPGTFEHLYTVSALTYLALFAAVLSMGAVGGPPAPDVVGREGPAPARSGTWWDVLRDRTLLRFALVGLIMLTFGYGSIDAGAALYITAFVGLDERFIGITFAANTAVIVVGQLVALSLVSGRSRSRVLAGAGVLWAACWLLFGAALGLPTWAAVAASVLAMAVFAVGETLWSPTAPAVLNDLAPEHLRGRYNAFQSVLWGISNALGPLLTGVFLAGGHALSWTLTLALGCLVSAGIALRLRRHLTPAQDGRVGTGAGADDRP